MSPFMKHLCSITYLLCFLFLCQACTNKNNNISKQDHVKHKYNNALVNESSPYLLQHAHNPVNWYPWGDEAMQKAKDENKLLIISVGYAACHWCHVMEHESFENEEVAAKMNEHFISIKVDREERPDVDDIYMTACNLISGRGGWPLNAIALADGQPFFAGTYFPQDQWMDILDQIIKMKETEMPKLVESAEKITQGIQEVDIIDKVEEDIAFNKESLEAINTKFMERIDFRNGGRVGSPKFPMPNNYEYLLKYGTKYNDSKSLQAVELTLDKMAFGGIYDQLGGGFARYSVDDIWLVPHFEKMLYDNGQLITIYAQGYKHFKKPVYKEVIDKTLAFVERELMSSDYGFYSSLDADSEGEEGKFYVWSEQEIDSLLDEEAAKHFKKFYDVRKSGNWEHTNILNRPYSDKEVADQLNISIPDLKSSVAASEEVLFKERSKRIRPGTDDKILTSWNGLMLSGYIEAYDALGDKHYLDIALKNAQFIKDNLMQSDGRLDRNFKNNKSSINAFLDDYALIIKAFAELYESTLDESWLSTAEKLMSYAIEHFYEESSGVFNYTSKHDPALIARKVEYMDNEIPASNSIMANNLFKLGTLNYKLDYLAMAKQMLKNYHEQIVSTKSPDFYSNWLQLMFDLTEAPYEVAIVGPDAVAKRDKLAKNYLNNTILLGGETEGTLPLLSNKLQEGDTYIYVCKNKVCKLPTDDVEKALSLMN